MIRQIKAWGIYHPKHGPLSYGDGSPLVFKDREDAQYECPENGSKAVRVTAGVCDTGSKRFEDASEPSVNRR